MHCKCLFWNIRGLQSTILVLITAKCMLNPFASIYLGIIKLYLSLEYMVQILILSEETFKWIYLCVSFLMLATWCLLEDFSAILDSSEARRMLHLCFSLMKIVEVGLKDIILALSIH